MRICVIGGTGHVGKYLTPMLVEAGHEVTVVASGRTPVPDDAVWSCVRVARQQYGAEGWTNTIRDLKAEVVIDILQGDSPALYAAVRETCDHLIVCGSVWMLGLPRVVPTSEETQGTCVFKGYARRYTQLLETKTRAAADGKTFTAIMPPNICGPYKVPLDGRGGRSLEIHRSHRRGEPVILPEPGSTLIGPCDAEDIARGFFCAVQRRDEAADEVFNVGSVYALTAVKFIETYGCIYGVKIPIEFVSWRKFEEEVLPEVGAHWHFKANMCPDISKISRKLGYRPAHTPEQTLERAVKWMMDEKLL
ncbi:MAG: NAD(P)-dependent oxidoreductase [Verrucomicrobia bacterium]|nr:NAD(P)-dependent oxidoreductase [Verrucomicrobiota bacterium]